MYELDLRILRHQADKIAKAVIQDELSIRGKVPKTYKIEGNKAYLDNGLFIEVNDSSSLEEPAVMIEWGTLDDGVLSIIINVPLGDTLVSKFIEDFKQKVSK